VKRFLLLLTFALVACGSRSGEKEKAFIGCTGEVDRIRCEVAHVGGAKPVRVCWDLNLSCKNGKKITERFCQEVQPKASTTMHIRNDEIMGYDACRTEGAEVEAITNTRVTFL
jgi:hypothetical protein